MSCLRLLTILICLISGLATAANYDQADSFQFQLLGLMAPPPKPASGHNLCLVSAEIKDGFDGGKLTKELDKTLFDQISRYAQQQGRFSLVGYTVNANCVRLSIRFTRFADTIESRRKSYNRSETYIGLIRAELFFGQSTSPVVLSLDYSLPPEKDGGYTNHLPRLYGWSVINKSRFIEGIWSLVDLHLQGQPLPKETQLSKPTPLEWQQYQNDFGRPYQMYRQRQLQELTQAYSPQALSYSLEALDAYCSALLDSGHYRDFFDCMAIWDQTSFPLISGYRQQDLLTQRLRPGNFEQIPYLVVAPGTKSASMYRRELTGRRARLLADAHFQLGEYSLALAAAQQALDAYKPNHRLWTAASKRYTPEVGAKAGYRARATWAFPGAAIDYHWAADIMLCATIIAQSQLEVGNSKQIDEYVTLIQQIHRNANRQELLSQFPRIKNLFLNSIFLRAGQFQNMRFSDDNDESMAALGELTSVALLVGSLAVDDEYKEDVLGLADDIKAWSDEVLTPTYMDGAKPRETFQQAYILFQQGQTETALQYLQELATQPELNHFNELKWQINMLLGRTHEALGQHSEAISAYAQAMNQIERTRGNISTESMKIGFASQRAEVYHALIRRLISQNRLVDAFNVAERARARAMVDMLANSQLRRTSNKTMLPDSIKHIASVTPTPAPLSHGTDLRGLKLKKLELTEERQQNKLRESLQVDSLINMATLDYDAIADYLDNDTVALEFVDVAEQTLVFKLYQGQLSAQWLTLNNNQIMQFRQQLQNPDNHNYLPAAQTLYQQLLAPLELPVDGTLLISPAGKLNYIPFAALHDGQKFIVERFAVVNLPSLTLLSLFPASQHDKSTLALGNPTGDLPGAQSEVLALKQQEPQTQVLLQQNASETQFKQLAGHFSRLHIASHGEFNASDPMLTRLRLAGDSHNDGDLTLNEIYGLKLNADLVVLSGCETGLNELAQGEEIIGFIRGFLFAGTNNIVASLWQVSDASTQQLMSHFYQANMQTPLAESLRQAQVSLLRQSTTAHPFYWGAFVLTGKGRI